jgi:hypothetical protein
MTDRAATFERVLRLEPGRTALLVVDMTASRARSWTALCVRSPSPRS